MIIPRRTLLLGAAAAIFGPPLAWAEGVGEGLIIEGDSQSAARTGGVTAAQTWGARIAARKEWDYTICAVGGSTSAAVLARIDDTMKNPGDHFAMMIGANDAQLDPYTPYDMSSFWTEPQESAVSLQTFISNLEDIADTVLYAGKSCTFFSPWPFWTTTNLEQFPFYVDAMAAVCNAKGVWFVDAWSIAVRRWWNCYAETTHPFEGAPPFYSTFYEPNDYQHPPSGAQQMIADEPLKSRYAGCPLH